MRYSNGDVYEAFAGNLSSHECNGSDDKGGDVRGGPRRGSGGAIKGLCEARLCKWRGVSAVRNDLGAFTLNF